MGNRGDIINQAKLNKKDEFYTRLVDVQNECDSYKKQFEDKVIYCNCDNPLTSNFFRYFVENFNEFKVKKVICSCFDSSSQLKEMWADDEIVDTKAYKVVVNRVDKSIDKIREQIKENKSTQDIEVSFLQSDMQFKAGDFRSDDCVQIMNEADIIITNPPFSLFLDYMKLLWRHNKKYLVMGNTNAMMCNDVFSRLMKKEIKFGYNTNITTFFEVPDDYFSEKGDGLVEVPAITWYTNLEVEKHISELIPTLYKKYNETDYPFYEDYPDIINIDKVVEMPVDYFGVMGVPISFVKVWNEDEFELLGRDEPCISIEKCYKYNKRFKEFKSRQKMYNGILCQKTYHRLFIKRR